MSPKKKKKKKIEQCDFHSVYLDAFIKFMFYKSKSVLFILRELRIIKVFSSQFCFRPICDQNSIVHFQFLSIDGNSEQKKITLGYIRQTKSILRFQFVQLLSSA